MDVANHSVNTVLQEKAYISAGVQTEQTIAVKRRLELEENISTPPSELRKQISFLRDELSEAYEFHDLELQVLKEECGFGSTEVKMENKNLHDLEKSLRDAEQIILEGNKEISNLKTINHDLKKKLEEESSKCEVLKTEYEDIISKLNIYLKKKDLEIEHLKKDKDDFEFRLQLISENYNRKISEFKSALEKKNEEEDVNERNNLIGDFQRRLQEENEKTEELSKELAELKIKLLLNKETVKLPVEQVIDISSKQNDTCTDAPLSDDLIEGNFDKTLEICSHCQKFIETRAGELEKLVDQSNSDLLNDNETNTESTENCGKNETEFVNVSVQTNDDLLRNSYQKIEEIRCWLEKEIKKLEEDDNIRMLSLECSNEHVQHKNMCLKEKLEAANKVFEELSEKLLVSIENVHDLRLKLEEIKTSESESVKQTSIYSSQNEISITTGLVEEFERKVKEIQSENEILECKISNLNDELRSGKEELASLKDGHERELKKKTLDWECRVEELKLEKEKLNSIIVEKDEKLNMISAELSETKNKLEENERNLKDFIKDNENYIDLLNSEKVELQNWVKAREEEINNLNLAVENKLIELKTDSDLRIEELKTMYQVEIKNLENKNDALHEQIESIQDMYETEIMKFVNFIEEHRIKSASETIGQVRNNSCEKRSDDEEIETPTLEDCISKIKVERDSLVEMCNSQLMETSLSITDNIKCGDVSDALTVIQPPNFNEMMSLVPARPVEKFSSGTIGNYNLHTMDEENMQLKINSESTMIEFVNEFAKVMLNENVINPEELKTCTNIFYSLFNKYIILLEMYSRLKIEYDEYKVNEQKERFDIVNRTVHYLDTLCSQLEVSGSSLNLSNSSFMSFNEGLPSSTIMEENYTEMEISAINNVTMSKDPLALTRDMSLQTPLKTPFKTAKKVNQFPCRTPLRSVSKPAKTPLRPGSVRKQISGTPAPTRLENCTSEMLIELKNSILMKDKELTELKAVYNKKVESSENALQEMLSSFALLEERIAKLETLYVELQNQRENLVSESVYLKETLAKRSEEISDIRHRLSVEIISLNPQLEGTFSNLSVTDLLSIFLNTIMESCKKMPEELSDKMVSEMKALVEKIELYEGRIDESAKEIDFLKELNANLMEEKEIIKKTAADRDNEILTLKQENSELTGLKSKMKDLEERLAENNSILKTEIYLKENTLKDLQKLKSFFEDVEKENSNLKQKIEQSDKIMYDLKTELMMARKEQINNEMKEDELMKEIEELKSILSGSETKNNDLRRMIDDFEEEVSSAHSSMKYRTCQLQLLNNKITDAEKLIQERDDLIRDLKEKISDLEIKLESGSVELLDFTEKYRVSRTEVEQLRQTVETYKESVNEEITSLKNELSAANADSSSKMGIIQELSSQLEEAKERAREQMKTITVLRERVEELEVEKEEMTTMKSKLEKRDEENKTMAEEIEELKAKVVTSETYLTGKIEDAKNLSVELNKARELNIQNEETISTIKKQLEELEEEKSKLESMESTLEKYREVQRVMMDETETLKSKLMLSEADVKEKIEKLTEMTKVIERTSEMWIKDEELITSLKIQIQEMETDRLRLEELESTVEKLRENEQRMTQEINYLNSRLETSETEKNGIISKMKETEAVKIENDDLISTLQKKIEDLRIENMKILSLEKIIEKHEESEKVKVKKIEELNLKLASVESEMIGKIATIDKISAQLEVGEKIKADCDVTILALSEEIELLKTDIVNLKTVQNTLEVELYAKEVSNRELQSKINNLLAAYNQEVEKMKGDYDETTLELKKEIEQLKTDIVSLKTVQNTLEDELKGKEMLNEELKTEMSKLLVVHNQEVEKVKADCEERVSELKEEIGRLEKNVISLEKVQNTLEDELNEKEVLNEELKSEMSKLLVVHNQEVEKVKADCEERVSELKEEIGRLEKNVISLEKVQNTLEVELKRKERLNEELETKMNNLLVAHTQELESLKDELTSSKEVNQILNTELDKLNAKMADDLASGSDIELEVSELLRSSQISRRNRTRERSPSSFRRLGKLENLNGLLNDTIQKNKADRKSNICNRKLEKLEELHQSLIDLLKKMLALIGMENLPKLNLSTARTFELEVRKVWDYFNGWISSKTKEVEELRSQMKELDEECESYAKVIIETKKETDRVWEKSRSEVKNLETQIGQLQEEIKALQSEKEALLQKLESHETGEVAKNGPKTRNDNDQTEQLKKQNLSLQSRIKELENSLVQAREQIQELDEECESYAKVIKENQRESLLIEETKNEIEALKEQIEKMDKEKKCLEEEKITLEQKIQVLESSSNQQSGSSDNVQRKRESKEVKELKRTLAVREMKILELEQLNEKKIIHKSQIQYLENSVAVLKDQLAQEESKNQKLQREINELSARTRKSRASEDVDLLNQLRPRDSLGLAALNPIDDKGKLNKLEKDNRMLKEICRTRYKEIKRLESENQSLKGHERMTKNSNQMDSPIRTRCYNTRFKKY